MKIAVFVLKYVRILRTIFFRASINGCFLLIKKHDVTIKGMQFRKLHILKAAIKVLKKQKTKM